MKAHMILKNTVTYSFARTVSYPFYFYPFYPFYVKEGATMWINKAISFVKIEYKLLYVLFRQRIIEYEALLIRILCILFIIWTPAVSHFWIAQIILSAKSFWK